MYATVVMKDFEIHTTPLEEIVINSYSITVFLDDVFEKRFKITFCPFQLFKVLTIDCASAFDYYNDYSLRGGRYHRHILEMKDSPLIKELKENAPYCTFLEKSRHFVLPLQENIVEVVAYDFTIEPYPNE